MQNTIGFQFRNNAQILINNVIQIALSGSVEARSIFSVVVIKFIVFLDYLNCCVFQVSIWWCYELSLVLLYLYCNYLLSIDNLQLIFHFFDQCLHQFWKKFILNIACSIVKGFPNWWFSNSIFQESCDFYLSETGRNRWANLLVQNFPTRRQSHRNWFCISSSPRGAQQ